MSRLLRQMMLADAPFGLYPLSEPSTPPGAPIKDIAGGNNASVTGTLKLAEPGPGELRAIRPSAGTDIIQTPTTLVAPTGADFTVCAFIQILGTPQWSGGAGPVLSQYYNTFANRSIWYVTTGNPSSFGVQIGGSSVDAPAGVLPLGRWLHLAWRRTSGTVELYLNGISVASGALAGTVDSKPSWIGTMSQTGTNGGVNGRLAYLGVWQSSLDARRLRAYAYEGLNGRLSPEAPLQRRRGR